MPDNASEKRDKALDFIVEEYKALWEYYRRTLDEREITLAYDFKSVTIPATALTVVLALNARGGGSQDFPAIVVPANIVAGVFLVLFLLGLTCLFKYGLESENARYFLRSINPIRKFAITEFSPLSHALNVDRVRPGSRPAWLQIPTYGELLICTVNAALAAAAISIVFDTADNTALMRVASLFIGLILIQWASAKMLSSAFRSYEPCPALPTMRPSNHIGCPMLQILACWHWGLYWSACVAPQVMSYGGFYSSASSSSF